MFRFEYFENVISKHHLSNVSWTSAAGQSAVNMRYKTGIFSGGDMTICNVRMIDDNTVEIIKRRNQSKPMFFKWGVNQEGLFERVTINRKECTVSVDRIDKAWRIQEPFLGQRDFFYVERKDKEAILNMTANKERLAFVRHDFWLHKMMKFNAVFGSYTTARAYKSAFKGF